MSQDIEYMRAWRKANADKVRAYRGKYSRKKRVILGTGCPEKIGKSTPKRTYVKQFFDQKSVRRFDPLVNWGFSTGKHKGAMVHFHV